MEQYWAALQQRVCRKCVDGDGHGNCRLPKGQSCAVREFLPDIVRTVQSIESDQYNDYVAALRTMVCAKCSEQGVDSFCRRREQVECALDRYFGLVLHVIDDVKAHGHTERLVH